MSKTIGKLQVQCSDLEKALNEESFLKDEAIEKSQQIEQKVGKNLKFCMKFEICILRS